ncbi:cytochrome P450 [Amycolatopsis sp. VS8301801F10]|uniref:cytochrome P450 n=1 Tax=Amycolatopsis sp. VS8301801F10 TaxID=2652442 RepID=UPI0038FC85C2
MTADAGLLAQLLPYDPFDPAFLSDPYPTYRKLREESPILRTPAGIWTLTGFEDCSAVLRDPRFGWGDGATVADHFTTAEDGSVVRPFIFADPPEHTRIRTLVSKAFAARRVDRMRDRARELANELVGAAVASGTTDLMSAVAHPLPALLLGELMAVEPEHEPRFRQLTSDIARGLDPSFFLTPEEIAKRDNGRRELREYFATLVEARRGKPGDDLVSNLVAAEEAGDRLTEFEILVTCTLLLGAGYATTVNLIGNGMLALLRTPGQLEWLRAHRDAIPGAVEEMLRFDAPVQVVSRTVLAEAEIGGTAFQPGEQLMLLLGAANRDPALCEDPEELRVARPASRTLAFGLGIHFCVGAPVARLAAQSAVDALLDHDLVLAGEPSRVPNVVMRGLAELPVEFRD